MADDVIFIRNLMSINEGYHYKREVTPLIDEVSAIGGLVNPLLAVGLIFSAIFVDPFRKLELSMAFSKLKAGICETEGLSSNSGSDYIGGKYSCMQTYDF